MRRPLLAPALALPLMLVACGKTEAPSTPAPIPVIAVAPATSSTVGVLPGVSLASTSDEDTASDVAAFQGDDPLAPRCTDIRIVLKATKNKWGNPGPGFVATIINGGEKSVMLVDPGDGSEVGWRTPIIKWKVTKPDGTILPRDAFGGRCGNVNAITDKEIFTLKPRAKHDLGDWVGAPSFSWTPGGNYDVQLVYDNDPQRDMRGLGMSESSPTALALIKKSTVCKVESNVVRIVF